MLWLCCAWPTTQKIANLMKNPFVLLSFAILSACVAVIPIPQQSVSRDVPATVATAGFGGALNDMRRAQGLAPLGEDARLTRAAQGHADHMAQAGYFSHQSPGGPLGNNMSARIRSTGCQPGAMSENIAYGQRSEAEVLAGWTASPGHLTNMMGPRYRSFGLGQSGDIWVLNLADGC